MATYKPERLIQGGVTTVSSADTTVLRIASTYEVRGMVETITSYNSATVGSGTVVNQVMLTYNSFGQLTKEEQENGGVVSVSTPSVQYAYDNGSANQVRLTGMTYPNGRQVSYDYGTSGGSNDRLNRVESIKDGSTVLAGYTRLGL